MNDFGPEERKQMFSGPSQMPFSVNYEEMLQIFKSEETDDAEKEQYFCPQTGAHFHKVDLY